MMVSSRAVFFQRDILDEIWDLIESVSEGIPTYSSNIKFIRLDHKHIGLGRRFSPFLRCFWFRLTNLILKDTNIAAHVW